MGADERVRIFDTTLRDGEQAPGCTLRLAEKLAVAEQLTRLGVDIIEAGFPAASAGEAAAVSVVARRSGSAGGPIICGLARATAADIETCARAIERAARPRIHTFIATSDLHLEHKLHLTRAEVLAQVYAAVTRARALVDDVEFSAEDASRSDPAFACDVFRVAMQAGATTLNVPDTVGYAMPEEYAALVARVCALAAESPEVVVSTHCHDDLGLAVANSLAGIRAGARQVECTVNGIGERAGNASLEEVVMALHTRAAYFGVSTGVETRELMRSSRLVAESAGMAVPPNKAIVGGNAFAHEAGIHQDGMLKHRSTYEIITPELVGHDGMTLVLGKHSGRRAVRRRLEELGHELGDDDFTFLFQRFKELADRKKTIGERDLLLLLAGDDGPRTRPARERARS
jgi:2-isopropylmalate synthase